jgi:hypothetical protein
MWNTAAIAGGYNVVVAYGYRDARTASKKLWSKTAPRLSQVLSSADSTMTLKRNEVVNTKISFNVTASLSALW